MPLLGLHVVPLWHIIGVGKIIVLEKTERKRMNPPPLTSGSLHQGEAGKESYE